ncbi:hypothetical protein CEXT_220141, partial [Caerostris extrusa]
IIPDTEIYNSYSVPPGYETNSSDSSRATEHKSSSPWPNECVQNYAGFRNILLHSGMICERLRRAHHVYGGGNGEFQRRLCTS